MLCRFPDKECCDRYTSYGHNKYGKKYCRIAEWKRKFGKCPYDKTMHRLHPHMKRLKLPKGQKKLI